MAIAHSTPWLRPCLISPKTHQWSTSTKLQHDDQTVNDGVAHSKNPKKCAYHMTFDLDLDLEHTLDAC